jgi:hypothetical protein
LGEIAYTRVHQEKLIKVSKSKGSEGFRGGITSSRQSSGGIAIEILKGKEFL